MSILMHKRSELLAKITVQRAQIAKIGDQWQAPLALADKGVSVVRFLRAYPVLVAGVVAFFMVRRRGVSGLISRVWSIYRSYRFLTTLSAKMGLRS